MDGDGWARGCRLSAAVAPCPCPAPLAHRLTEELQGDELLARLLRTQNQRLHEVASQGLEHPIFHQA